MPHRADERGVQAHLRELAAALSAEGINASLEIKGDVGTRPAHAVVEVARSVGADLIVAGTRGHSVIGGIFCRECDLNRLLHLAPCPVLVVPATTPWLSVGPTPRATGGTVDLHCHLLPGIDDRADHAVRIGRTPQSCCGTSLTAPVGQRR